MKTSHTVFQDHRQVKKLRTGIALLTALMLLSISTAPTLVSARSESMEGTVVLQPATAPMLTGTFQAVNAGPGDQTDPHVDCNRASYANDDFFGSNSIHYFDFATSTDHEIPGNGTGILSDVFGGTVAFSEATPSDYHIVLFDIATQTRTVVPGLQNSHPVLGGNLVAFETQSFWPLPNETELMVYDRSSNNEITRLSNDFWWDKNADVSPNGNAIVWQKCFITGLGCGLYSVIRNGPGDYTIRLLKGDFTFDPQPVTNGQLVAYLSNQTGENDIYFQPVTGGAETHLSIPGDQRNVSISGNLISFESQMPSGNTTEYDIFVYDINTENLYRVTNTAVNETLSDITMCSGIARIVYGAPGIDFDVHSFTFQPPSSTPEDQINDLIALIESFGLPRGPENSLITKLESVLAAVDASDIATACSDLTAFINECQAQSGKKLTANQANQLITAANQIKTDLGCQ